MTFDEQIESALRKKVLSEIEKTEFTKIEYGDRKKLPPEFLEELWASIDWDEVINDVRPKLQTRICNTIVGAMETELKTDVKKLMAVDGVRQKLRMEVYPKLMGVLNSVDT